MRRLLLGTLALLALAWSAVPAQAHPPGGFRDFRGGFQDFRGGFRDFHHERYHDELAHREFHRQLLHREAHRYPMTWRQHERLHDMLDHDRFHDRLEHRQYHRNRAFIQPYGGYYVVPQPYLAPQPRFHFQIIR